MAQDALRDRENLVFRLQPWTGEPIAKEGLVMPPAEARGHGLAFGYMGDMQLRLVFESPDGEPGAVRAEDLQRMDLTPGKAVGVGLANFKRRQGPPQVSSLGGGVYVLRCAQQEQVSAYFLDRSFWREQLLKFPQGLLAALPRPGVLMFTPAGDAAAQAELERQAARMLHGGAAGRLSACVYQFGATGWAPVKTLSQPPVATPAQHEAQVREHEEEDDLEKAARGQKILIYSILLGFVSNAMVRAGVHPVIMLALFLALGVYGLWGVVILSSGLRQRTGVTLLFMVASCIPLVSLLAWIILSVLATRRLRAAGWRVGLLGARP
jgi:hypothetical protein